MKSVRSIIKSLMVMLSLAFASGCDTSGSGDPVSTGKVEGVEETLYSFSANLLGGEEISLEKFRGKVVLVVNTASKCGFTPQYGGLEKLYEQYKEQGFEVLGFPCNQFAWQEPGSADEISQFCKQNYGVSFTMFDKINVNGKESHPLYLWLTKELPGSIKWNFTKFLIDRKGKPVKRYGSSTKPADIAKDIEALLKVK